MEAAPEQGVCPAGAEAEPCPEPPAHRLSAAELDRELDSRSELVRREPLRGRGSLPAASGALPPCG